MRTRTFPALGFDPAPGDPGEAEYLARIVRDASSTLGVVNSVVSSTATDGWRVRPPKRSETWSVTSSPPLYGDASQSFDRATRALTTWTSTLADQQVRADNLERRAQDALDRLHGEEQALASVGEAPTAASLTSGGREPTDQELDQARQEHEQTLAVRHSTVADAQAEYDTVVGEAHRWSPNAISDADLRRIAKRDAVLARTYVFSRPLFVRVIGSSMLLVAILLAWGISIVGVVRGAEALDYAAAATVGGIAARSHRHIHIRDGRRTPHRVNAAHARRDPISRRLRRLFRP